MRQAVAYLEWTNLQLKPKEVLTLFERHSNMTNISTPSIEEIHAFGHANPEKPYLEMYFETSLGDEETLQQLQNVLNKKGIRVLDIEIEKNPPPLIGF